MPRKVWIGGARPCPLGLLGLVVLWAGGVFKVRTADGILVVQVNEPNAEVFVDGDRMTVSWNDGGTKAEIHVKPGTRKVEVKKDGFGVDGTDLTFRDGDREVFTARLLPEPRWRRPTSRRRRSRRRPTRRRRNRRRRPTRRSPTPRRLQAPRMTTKASCRCSTART